MKNLSGILLIMILVSCELIIDVPRPEFDSKLVLFGFINSDSSISISLSHDQYVLDNSKIEGVKGASVQLYEDGLLIGALIERSIEIKNEWDNEPYVISGTYEIDYKPKHGKTYRIEAAKNGYKSIVAETSIPLATNINVKILRLDTIEHLEEPIGDGDSFSWKQYILSFEISDSPGENFYLLDMSVEEYLPLFYFNPDIGKYDFDSIIGSEKVIQKIYFEPDNILFESQNWYGNKLIFDDQLFDNTKYKIDLKFEYFRNNQSDFDFPPPIFFLELRQINREYFEFLKSLYIQENNGSDPFSEPTQIFTNVENGFGVFAGYQKQWLEVSHSPD